MVSHTKKSYFLPSMSFSIDLDTWYANSNKCLGINRADLSIHQGHCLGFLIVSGAHRNVLICSKIRKIIKSLDQRKCLTF